MDNAEFDIKRFNCYNKFNCYNCKVKMHHIPAKQARLEFTHISDEVAFRGERYVVTRNGRELMAMISMEDLEVLQTLENQRDLELANKAEADICKHGTVSWEEMEKRLGIDRE